MGRYGGDEFLAILSGTDEESAQKLAEGVRKEVEGLGTDAEGERVWDKVTISIGQVTATPDAVWNPSQLFTAVDYALYQAKNAGRNCVFLFKHPGAVGDRGAGEKHQANSESVNGE